MSHYIPLLGISVYWGDPQLPTSIETHTSSYRTHQAETDRFLNWPIRKIYGVGNSLYLLALIRVDAPKQVNRSVPRAQEPSA